jgi:lipopolysaccharide transport system ATP-binding protein
MSDTVIRVENLGKRYIIGHQQQEKYTALRDVLANTAKGITQRLNPKSKFIARGLSELFEQLPIF